MEVSSLNFLSIGLSGQSLLTYVFYKYYIPFVIYGLSGQSLLTYVFYKYYIPFVIYGTTGEERQNEGDDRAINQSFC
jgi:hypothetical protein